MTPTNLVPVLDLNPLPAPYWVFKLLLLLTFFLHLLAMNAMLGGAVLAVLARFAGKDRAHGNRVFFDVAKKIPSLLPATVTLGIAPLLFLQVIYGQFFYTSSVVMAWPWFSVLVMLTIAYYGFYYVSYRGGKDPGRAGWVMLVSTLLITAIGFIYSNNITLSMNPDRWAAKYFAHPNGLNLNLTEPSLFPRFLHFFVAAIAVGGLLLVFMALANWKRDNDYARRLLYYGGKTFTFATMAQFVVGIVFLMSLPRDMVMLFMGGNPLASGLMVFGIVASAVAIVIMSKAVRTANIRAAAVHVPAITAIVIGSMVVMRDILRDAYLKPWFHPEQFTVKTQWTVLPLFLVLFVAGVALWLVMMWRFFKAKGTSAS